MWVLPIVRERVAARFERSGNRLISNSKLVATGLQDLSSSVGEVVTSLIFVVSRCGELPEGSLLHKFYKQ